MSEPKSFICEPGPEWIQQISGWIWACYPNVSFPRTCKRTWATYTGKVLNMYSSTPVQNQREVNIVSAATLLCLRGTHCCEQVLIFQIIVHPKDWSWQNSNRNLEAENWAGPWKSECSLPSYSVVLSACFFIQARNHLHRVVPHTVGWTLPHQIVNQEDSHTGLLSGLSHGGGCFPVDSLSSQSSLCQVDKNITSTIGPLSTRPQIFHG